MTKAELIKKFLDNNCTEEEARLVMQYLEAEPSLLDEMLSKSEWDEIDAARPITPGVELEMSKVIAVKTMRPVFRIAWSALKVAAVLAAVVFGLTVLHHSTRKSPVEDQLAVKTETVQPRERIYNNTFQNKQITLADNSTITLFPGSTVEYDIAFRERSITLKGKAIFKVVKNTASKFVVHSGAITTTALGTRFLVDNSNDGNKINVQLFEGKVVVEPAEASSVLDETFLVAGEQCFVDLSRMLVKVEPLFTSTVVAQKKSSTVDKNKNVFSSAQAAGRLNFSQTPLHEVLENLRLVYKQPISFKEEDVRGKHFTGSFTNHDSLSVILRMISVMNELNVVTEKGVFNVVKAAPEKEIDNKPGTNNRAKDGNDPTNFGEPGNYYEPESDIGRQDKIASLASNVPQVNIERKSINVPASSDDEHGSSPADNATDHINITAYAQRLTENLKQPERAPAAAQTVQSEAGLTMIEEKVVDQAAAKYTRIPLPDLLAELQKLTKRKIHFNSAQLDKINFTGSIPFDDAIRTTLATICRINGLTLTIKKGAYYIN